MLMLFTHESHFYYILNMRTLIEDQSKTIKFDSTAKIEKYLNERVAELRKLADDNNHENPYVFMGISAIFDLLSYLPYDDTQMNAWKDTKGNDLVSARYKQFLKDYVFNKIQFQFNAPLNELFYQRVRCGLDHAFSTHDMNSTCRVLLSHDQTQIEEVNLQNADGTIEHGIIFTACAMIKLLKESIQKIFKQVNNGNIPYSRIENRFKAKKPLSKFYN